MMHLVAAIILLIIAAFVVYRTANPKTEIAAPGESLSEAWATTRQENTTRREVARWLSPCSSRLAGVCGPALNCCGCMFKDEIKIKP